MIRDITQRKIKSKLSSNTCIHICHYIFINYEVALSKCVCSIFKIIQTFKFKIRNIPGKILLESGFPVNIHIQLHIMFNQLLSLQNSIQRFRRSKTVYPPPPQIIIVLSRKKILRFSTTSGKVCIPQPPSPQFFHLKKGRQELKHLYLTDRTRSLAPMYAHFASRCILDLVNGCARFVHQ